LPCRVFAKGPTNAYQELPTKKVPGGYQCLYAPKECGNNTVKVEFAGKEVPNSPYHVSVVPDKDAPVEAQKVQPVEAQKAKPVEAPKAQPIDVSKVQIRGLESRKLDWLRLV